MNAGLNEAQAMMRQRQLPVPAEFQQRTDKSPYTVAEVAELTGYSRQTITRMFECEKGVLVLVRPETMHKRGYRNIRIPRAVFERVLGRVQVR